MKKRTKTAVATGTLIAAPLLLAITACDSGGTAAQGRSAAAAQPEASHSVGTPSPAPASGPARKLAALDGNPRPADSYQQVLSALAPRCKEDPSRVATAVDSTLKALKKKGIDGEDEFGVLQHLEAWVPAGKPKVSCLAAGARYAAQRTDS
ncbi:hypothetical protein [Streptomyces arenae]|uniref:hypothetical protein n=1 Tax=Streptomyces arenae TaxID=29301 RepID=UPI0026595E07|nr:hypothetical protein [Streptomyces arenae]MCG7205641.1 hypothetical protein [Streptomyces arenae]